MLWMSCCVNELSSSVGREEGTYDVMFVQIAVISVSSQMVKEPLFN